MNPSVSHRPAGRPARCPLRPGRVAGLGLLLTLAACGTPLPAEGPTDGLEIPAGWSASDAAGAAAPAAGDASLATWWRRFDDPQMEVLVVQALRASTSVATARATLDQARALRDLADASRAPTLDASASAERGRADGRSTGNELNLGVQANFVVDVFGAGRAAVSAAQADLAADDAGLGDVQVRVAAAVADGYITLRSAQARAAIARDNLDSLEETLQITRWRLQAGLISTLEAEQARAAVEQGRARLPPLRSTVLQTHHALAVLTGQPPAAWPELVDPRVGAEVPQAGDEPALRIPAQVLRRRADVRAVEHRVAAALSRVGQAQAQRWPSFAIGGSLALGAATVGALGSSGAAIGSLLAGVTLPVFDGGALRAQVAVQQAALALARQDYRATVLGALQQVEDVRVALQDDRLRLDSLRQAAAAAATAAALARQRYGSGLVDFQTVLETQRTQFSTQDDLASARADLGRDQVRLFAALGGGWTPDPAPDDR